MKVLYFFDILEGNFINFYLKIKKKEVLGNIKRLKKSYSGAETSAFCLNRGRVYLASKNFDNKINSVLDEYLQIDRNTYNDLVSSVWSDVKTSFENLTKTQFNVLNNFWNILEYRVTKIFMEIFEKIDFIKSIINRENPDIVYISQKDSSLFNFLKKELNLENIKFLFLKSRIDYSYNKIIGFASFFNEMISNFRDYLKYKFLIKMRRIIIPDEDCSIGISAPGNYYNSQELACILDGLKIENLKYQLFIGGMYGIRPTLKNFKSNYASNIYFKLNIKHFFDNSRKKDDIVRYLAPLLRDYAYPFLIELLSKEIIRIIYILKMLHTNIESANYKVILILNEFGEPGKIINNICKSLGIPVYFVPYCGIPRRESDVTPHLSEVICVDGELDKEYLTNKGVNPEKIVIRGAPKYQSLLNHTISPLHQLKDHFSGQTHEISKEKHKILLAANYFSNEANLLTLTTVISALKKIENIQFIIKLHPKQDGIFIKDVLKKLNYEAIIVKDVGVFELIKTADIFLTEESSIILDSMVVGTPIICLDLSNKSIYFSATHVYNDEKYIIRVQNESQLHERLYELINSPENLEKYRNSLKINLKSILYHKDNYSPTQQIISDLKKFC